MIKINLLLAKKKPPKKLTALQQQMVLVGFGFGLLTAGMYLYTEKLNDQIAGLERDKASAEARIRDQENMLKEVQNIEEERKKVLDKISIIEQLKKNQAGPVRILDELSRALPTGVNIDSLTESGGNINISGMAFTNDDIVRYVDNLKNSPFFADVYLIETIQGKEADIEIYKYKMQFRHKGL